jgi:hypothetical protein
MSARSRPGRSFDHFIGRSEQGWWDDQSKCLCSLEIDKKLEFCRLLYRQVGRLFTFEDSAEINACLAIQIREACPVAHESPRRDVLAKRVNHRHSIFGRQRHEPLTLGVEKGLVWDNEPSCARLRQSCKCFVKRLLRSGINIAVLRRLRLRL